MITPQSMSDLVVSSIDAGLLRREAAEVGRAAKLEVTAQGKALLRRAYPIVAATNRDSFAALSRHEQATLGDLLRKLLA